MTKRMLIDATHAEETRVVVLDGNRLEDFDVETSAKRHLKGNIYLAKVVRVEPSLQAAFVEYGGNRHGFLAFSEIHPDYYQIPVADRQRLLEMEAEAARLEEEEDELELALNNAEVVAPPPPPPARVQQPRSRRGRRYHGAEAWAKPNTPYMMARPVRPAPPAAEAWARAATPALLAPPPPPAPVVEAVPDAPAESWAQAAAPALVGTPSITAAAEAAPVSVPEATPEPVADAITEVVVEAAIASAPSPALEPLLEAAAEPILGAQPWARPDVPTLVHADDEAGLPEVIASNIEQIEDDDDVDTIDHAMDSPPPETVGGDSDSGDDGREERRLPPRFLRNYKIQEVIRRRQIMLVQVVKEERGTKGAALTTYLSLAGRFSVLMPNSPRGGGISRKITSAADRRRLKEVMVELDIPRGMGMIIRTAGAARPKPEIKRDCEYLLRLWDDIREHTMKSVAPALIYEEASLIKRSIRDVYSRDIDEIMVDGEEGWRAAHDFMRMLMPSHARKVQMWRDPSQPLFSRHQVEAQLDAMLNPVVQLRSGGYLVINQAEALVAIDVNSGRSTRERNIEETALRTNLEAADEVARQLRLRDLAGLIVIDFIDMESKRHNAMVERRMKEALKDDRARIQVGHISHFGLLEMSRQRLRPSLAETNFIACPHCGGTGHVRSIESAAIHVLRGIEEEGSKRRAAEVIVHVATPIALFLLNHKRERLGEIEIRYGMRVIIAADDSQIAPRFRLERVRAQVPGETATFITPDKPQPALPAPVMDDEDEAPDEEPADEPLEAAEPEVEAATEEEAPKEARGETEDEAHRRKRRRRRGRRRDEGDREEGEGTEASGEAPAPDVAIDAVPGIGEASGPVVAAEPAAMAEAETQTDSAAVSTPEGEDDNARRRGRRGGRRRRKEPEAEVPEVGLPGAEQPEIVPAYSGPTPADPFGGQAFDIFDVMEQVERAAEAKAMAPAAVEAPAEVVAARVVEAPAEADAPAPVEDAPAPAAPVVAEAAPAAVIEAEPAPAPEMPAAQPAAVEPDVVAAAPAEAAPVADDRPAEPAIKPILVGAEEEPVAKKRGWWRR